MKATIEMDWLAMRALSLVSSVDATRYILNSVCIEVMESNSVRIVATDGRRLGAYAAPVLGLEREGEGVLRFVVPVEFIKTVPAATRNVTVSLEGYNGGTVCVQTPRAKFEGKLCEGSFPNWTAVVPDKPLVPSGSYNLNVELLAGLARAGALLECGRSKLDTVTLYEVEGTPSGIGIYVVQTCCPLFFAALMPVKISDPWKRVTAWARVPSVEPKPDEVKA